ncbi:MAG: hypothetical protein R3E44_10475 [Paracoccaceae bacterium]
MRFVQSMALCASFAATAAGAETSAISSRVGEVGIRTALTELEGQSDRTPDQDFALGALHVLGAVERALQARYDMGMNQQMLMGMDIPLLRLPVPENPAPKPFDPAAIEALFATASDDLAGAIAVLDTIGDADDFGLEVDTADLWFDINGSGARDEGEGMMQVLGTVMQIPTGEDGGAGGLAVRFDTADAAWLSAYAHLLSGISDTIVALHPTERLRAVLADAAALDEFGRAPNDYGMIDTADMIAALVAVIESKPDAERLQAAHAHFLAMIRDNRTFWSRVGAETDNNAEWIPNARQKSVLPIDFPPDTAEVWGGVLTEAEEMLEGKRLIPHWRLGAGVGVNLAKLMQDPPELDVIGMVQGGTLLPYIERGEVMSGEAFWRFEELVAGDAGLFMVILN